MAQRRALIDGVKDAAPVDSSLEEAFVYGKKDKSAPQPTPQPAPPLTQHMEGKRQEASTVGRVGLTTRIRADFAKALKRASLERQLSGQYPNTILDILEEALEPWLRSNGYLN